MATDERGFLAIPLTCANASGVTSAVVVPRWGANIIALSYRRADWAWPLPVLEAVDIASVALKPTSYGMPLLAPTPGRVGRNQDGRIRFGGRDYHMTPSRHGLLRDCSWEVSDWSTGRVTCEVAVDVVAEGAAPGNFPYRLHARHSVEVLDARLRSTLVITNTGDIAAPVGAGWHPYLQRAPGPCTVCIPAASQWLLDGAAEPTPTGELRPADPAFARGRVVVPGEHWDDVFTDLAADADGTVTCWVAQPAAAVAGGEPAGVRRFVRVHAETTDDAEAPVRHMQLYTPPGRAALTLEPLSSPPNAINLAAGGHARADLRVLTPGSTVRFSIEVGVSA